MHGFDTTIQLATLRQDELLRTARTVSRRSARRVRHIFPGRSV